MSGIGELPAKPRNYCSRYTRIRCQAQSKVRTRQGVTAMSETVRKTRLHIGERNISGAFCEMHGEAAARL